MKYLMLLGTTILSLNAFAQSTLELPSCNLPQQRVQVAQTGGQMTDPRQAHISQRANILAADVSTSRKARKLTQAEADHLVKRIEEIRRQSNRAVKQKGHLSAADSAAFDDELDGLAKGMCATR
ncbi:hypothetical protein [Pseudomonas trivialis]|uniref:Lipoprotein n=1 Tax=Pseudomonas trivialis TaxID=200450 RepID=A0A0R2ZCC7_9PSED|nr:hypothetical protein [Pseudomonas trivialis]KRP58242.1 hypothetical protein TU79_21310 [Pseudomonas trivialis]SDS90261.1 hypothetical protein SAMN04490205_4030 [Pseudomonas trivialis]